MSSHSFEVAFHRASPRPEGSGVLAVCAVKVGGLFTIHGVRVLRRPDASVDVLMPVRTVGADAVSRAVVTFESLDFEESLVAEVLNQYYACIDRHPQGYRVSPR